MPARRRNPTLIGYRPSVYTRVVLLALYEKEVSFNYVEVDPFTPYSPENQTNVHPFNRVPVLRHGDFEVYETEAITEYIDSAFEGRRLSPTTTDARVRSRQVISIVDSYLYWPFVRQVYAHSASRAAKGLRTEEAEILAGLQEAPRVLNSLETIAQEGLALSGNEFELADMHLLPMVDYFLKVAKAKSLFLQYPALNHWWREVHVRPSVRRSR